MIIIIMITILMMIIIMLTKIMIIILYIFVFLCVFILFLFIICLSLHTFIYISSVYINVYIYIYTWCLNHLTEDWHVQKKTGRISNIYMRTKMGKQSFWGPWGCSRTHHTCYILFVHPYFGWWSQMTFILLGRENPGHMFHWKQLCPDAQSIWFLQAWMGDKRQWTMPMPSW